MEIVNKDIETFKKTNLVKNKELVKFNDLDEFVTLPKEIEIIGDSAFDYNQTLTAIYLKDSVKLIKDGYILEASVECEPDEFVGAFSKCVSLEKVRLSASLQRIGNFCFSNCYSLKHVEIPESVEEIGKMAFYNCTELSNITISKNCKNILFYAFYNCYSLKVLFIPKSVEYIGKYAFSGMTEDQTIVFEGEEESSKFFHVGWKSGCEAKILWDYGKIKK